MCGCWTGFRRTRHKSFGVGDIGGVENGLALFDDGISQAIVKNGWSQQADSGMVMLLVVPVEKVDGEGARPHLRDGPGSVGEVSDVQDGVPRSLRNSILFSPAALDTDASVKEHALGRATAQSVVIADHRRAC